MPVRINALLRTRDKHSLAVIIRDMGFGGAGIELFLTDQLAMSFSWRIRHISNAGIEQPNPGLNTQFVMLGFDWFPKR